MAQIPSWLYGGQVVRLCRSYLTSPRHHLMIWKMRIMILNPQSSELVTNMTKRSKQLKLANILVHTNA